MPKHLDLKHATVTKFLDEEVGRAVILNWECFVPIFSTDKEVSASSGANFAVLISLLSTNCLFNVRGALNFQNICIYSVYFDVAEICLKKI